MQCLLSAAFFSVSQRRTQTPGSPHGTRPSPHGNNYLTPTSQATTPLFGPHMQCLLSAAHFSVLQLKTRTPGSPHGTRPSPHGNTEPPSPLLAHAKPTSHQTVCSFLFILAATNSHQHRRLQSRCLVRTGSSYCRLLPH
jgi:hypothetical protein